MGYVPEPKDDSPRSEGEIREVLTALGMATSDEERLRIEFEFVRNTANGSHPGDPDWVS